MQRLVDLEALDERDRRLQVVAFLAAHPQFVALYRHLNLELGALDFLDDLLRQFALDPLFDQDRLAQRVAGCLFRVLELEGIKKRKLTAALDRIARNFAELDGFIIDIRDCPGGDDDTAIQIINRFCDTRRVAFHRRTKTGPGEDDFSALKTWHIVPDGDTQFTGPIVLLTCDSVFSGGEVFALAIKELPHVTIIGDHTNGIFSYTLDKKLPNGWKYCLSYQQYFSADMVCFEGQGVPVDIELLNKKADIEKGIDPLITRALEVLKSGNQMVLQSKGQTP